MRVSLILHVIVQFLRQMAEHLLVGTLKRNSAGTAVADNLLSATARRDTALVARLLAHGADVDTTDAAGNTALMIAAARDYVDVAAILVDSGADVNVVGASATRR
jgi:hypothetical protein